MTQADQIRKLRLQAKEILFGNVLPNCSSVTSIGEVPAGPWFQAMDLFAQADRLERGALNFWDER